MPYHVKFERPPAGIALTSARQEGDTVTVQTRKFTSTEDGQLFIKRLEGFVDDALRLIAPQKRFRPSEVDHLLAIIRDDGQTTAYVNEIEQIVSIRPNRAIKKGEAVSKDDIVDFGKFHLDGIDIPNDAGVLFLFSIGWRKGLFFDLGPVVGDKIPREFSCEQAFGQFHGYVTFQERFGISETDWENLFQAKWFPFAAMKNETIDKLISHLRQGWDDNDITKQIIGELSERVDGLIEAWKGHPTFKPHLDVSSRAVERFGEKDYMSCSGLLYPRIEGLLRTHHQSQQQAARPTQQALSQSAVQTKAGQELCLLLPHKFQEYLQRVYFANFNPTAQQTEFSRHSVAHGVADVEDFNAKSAMIAILVVAQLYYYFDDGSQVRTDTGPSPPEETT